MPNLSLTDLVDIASAVGKPKITKVRSVKNRPSYSPAFDFYRLFREHIIEIHKIGAPKETIDEIINFLTDKKKETNYCLLIDGYKQWWGRKNITWFEPISAIYSAHGVDVRVNPELALEINGEKHFVKLYMKSDKLSKNRVDLILQLMLDTLSSYCTDHTHMSILDVRRHRMITAVDTEPYLSAAINAELAYIATLWDQI